ncbi:MAG: hypothetical protein H6671_13595 [Anaerolineaceae bacterium]|nr:hypothetical protein [Anaerolineaceae bacterium]
MTDPDTLHHYLDAWALSQPEALAETFTSTLYTVRMNGETAVLKLLKPVGIFDESPGAVALRCFNGQGAVRLLRHDERAHLLEYVTGEDLVPLVRRGEDDASSFYVPMRKSLGDKRREIADAQIAGIVRLYLERPENAVSCLFASTDFGCRKVTVERPLRLNFRSAGPNCQQKSWMTLTSHPTVCARPVPARSHRNGARKNWNRCSPLAGTGRRKTRWSRPRRFRRF